MVRSLNQHEASVQIMKIFSSRLPSQLYEPYMQDAFEMKFLLKHLVDFMQEELDNGPGEEDDCYERFLGYLADFEFTRGDQVEQLTSETFLKHAETLISQVKSLEDNAENLNSDLFKKICGLTGIKSMQSIKGIAKARETKKRKETNPEVC